jgi:hypothetical protein
VALGKRPETHARDVRRIRLERPDQNTSGHASFIAKESAPAENRKGDSKPISPAGSL